VVLEASGRPLIRDLTPAQGTKLAAGRLPGCSLRIGSAISAPGPLNYGVSVMKLSLFERVSLANQYRIRAKLENDDHLSNFADILERGYVTLYPRVFEWIYDETPDDVGKEVQDIFDMYRALDRAYGAGAKPPAGAFHPGFDGFDGNNDPHFGIASFLLDDLGLWAEFKDRPRNSHSMGTLGTYRKMLKAWNDLGRPFPLTQDHVDKIVIGP
jgi:uncharacterized protein YfbU (UPF0304 family)